MSKTCPTCHVELSSSSKPSSAWLPIFTVVGVSAAAILVYRQIKRAHPGGIESILDQCARAASTLDQRLGDGFSQAAG